MFNEVWIPQRQEIRKINGVKQPVIVKMFPGIVMLDTDVPEEFVETIRHSLTFNDLFLLDKRYISLAEDEAKTVRGFIGEDGIADMSEGVISDGKLIVNEGPLKGHESEITRVDRHKRKAWIKTDSLFGKYDYLSFTLIVTEKS